jgi:hypothetical protein
VGLAVQENKGIIMSYIEGTMLEEIIDRCVDNWAKLLGGTDPHDRGRESDGTFKADDPTTPEVNEAWKTGKSPKKKVSK